MNNFNFLVEEFNFSKKTIAQISHMSQAIITMYAKGEKKIPPSKALIFSNFFACDEDFINSEQNGRLLLGEFDIKKTKIFDGKPIFAFNPKRLTISEYNQYKNNKLIFLHLILYKNAFKVVRFSFDENDVLNKQTIYFLGTLYLQSLILTKGLQKGFFYKNNFDRIMNKESFEKIADIYIKHHKLFLEHGEFDNSKDYGF